MYKNLIIQILKINNTNEKNLLIDAGFNMIGTKIKAKFGSGITLKINEIKDIMKVSKFQNIEEFQSVLILLGLSTGMATADKAIQKNIYGSGTTALITSKEEMG